MPRFFVAALNHHGKYKKDYTWKNSYGGFPDADGTAETVMGEKKQIYIAGPVRSDGRRLKKDLCSNSDGYR